MSEIEQLRHDIRNVLYRTIPQEVDANILRDAAEQILSLTRSQSERVSRLEEALERGWRDMSRPYRMWHSPRTLHEDEGWVVEARGFGMRIFPTEQAALTEIEEYFGKQPIARVTISIFADRTHSHFSAVKGTVPSDVIEKALAAIEAEREALKSCPVHQSDGGGNG